MLFVKKMAVAQHKSMAEIIRQAVDHFARAKQPGGEEQRRKRAMAAVGLFRTRCQGSGSFSRFLPGRDLRQMSIFIDTSVFIAVLDMDDASHTVAAIAWMEKR